jgi:hypothetical protein
VTQAKLGVATWKFYSGRMEIFVSGLDSDGVATKGFAFAWIAKTKALAPHLRFRFLDGSKSAITYSFSQGASATGNPSETEANLVSYAIVDFYAAAKANAGKVGMRSGGGLHFLAGAQTCTDAYLEKAGA